MFHYLHNTHEAGPLGGWSAVLLVQSRINCKFHFCCESVVISRSTKTKIASNCILYNKPLAGENKKSPHISICQSRSLSTLYSVARPASVHACSVCSHCRFAFPQYLLSSHFLTEEQKDDVIRKGLVRRRRNLELLAQSVEMVAQGTKLHVCVILYA